MWEGRFRQGIRLRLLALVLALALTWYVLNPAPVSVRTEKRATEPPDEQHRDVKLPTMPRYGSFGTEAVVIELASPHEVENIDELEWPEVIEFS